MSFRDYISFNEELCKNDISATDWNAIYNECTNLHELTANVIQTISVVVDKHAPNKTISNSMRKKLMKPWIQRAKKVVSDSPGLVDFAIRLVKSVFNLPDAQVVFFEEFE